MLLSTERVETGGVVADLLIGSQLRAELMTGGDDGLAGDPGGDPGGDPFAEFWEEVLIWLDEIDIPIDDFEWTDDLRLAFELWLLEYLGY